ncbi:MAG TPA: 2-C-methyl-D-erythritol 4-phosphate cytidylyltransferase [Thermomicrobiales bacterium]|nr:2-C-methyl-D-erythritol 4-phosphate cytidylyltransferase [Thermomicrobiales bacterium]
MTQTAFAAAVIVAAGRGERFGDTGKVLAPVAGRPVLAWVLDAMQAAASVRDIVIVYGAHTEAPIRALVDSGAWPKVRGFVPGGEQRQASMANGVGATAEELDVVLVHDAARPLITPARIDACAIAARQTRAAILATPVADTIKRVRDGVIAETVDRAQLWAAQTPQGFHRADLIDFCRLATSEHIEFTDEASLAEALGRPVTIVPGDRLNIKITHPEDLEMVDALLRRRQGEPTVHVPRTGIGYDVHRFAEGRRMVLGGVEIPFERGLEGHSDADVLLHAIADGMLGAAALGDIGVHFPPTDERWRDLDSRDIVRHAVALLAEHGWRPVNLDATVIAEAPKITPHVARMREEIARATGLPDDAISIKATTNEGMGFVGREEGIAALAIATIVRADDA